MTLRSFHLFFITVSVLLALFFGLFELNVFQETGSKSDLAVSVISFIASLGLAVYGLRFRAKTRAA